MSNNDPKGESEIDDFRRALTTHNTKAPAPEQESAWDRITATLGDMADRSTGWAAARVKDTFQDFVGRVLYGETVSPEASDKHLDQARERDHAREPDKGVDR
jgi:hypothetical protein